MRERLSAHWAIIACLYKGIWSTDAIEAVCRRENMSERDRALCAKIVLGVLQNKLFLDHIITDVSARKPESFQSEVLTVLEIGAYQLLFLHKIPDHAAIYETVSLCDHLHNTKAKGIVNACLRRIAERRNDYRLLLSGDSLLSLSCRYSHPQELVDRLILERGTEAAEQILRFDNAEPNLCIQVNTLKITVSDYLRLLQDAGVVYRQSERISSCLHLPSVNVTQLPGFQEGYFFVQDEAARISVELAGIYPGCHVLDACASPGGKTMAAMTLLGNQGTILSCDVNDAKVRRLRENMSRMGCTSVSVRVEDACIYHKEHDRAFHVVIADVPCSGFGVISKRPEIRYKSLESVRPLPQVQYRILENLSKYVAPGGTLIYSTCTVLRAENEEVTNSFAKCHPEFTPSDFTLCDISSTAGSFTFLPGLCGTDGFYVAKFIRNRG